MDCVEARSRLDRGVVPGSVRDRDPLLGFHLAGCAACRAYRAAHPFVAPRLVTSHAVSSTIHAQPAVLNRASAPRRSSYRIRSLVGALLAVGLIILAGYIGLPLYRAYQHIAAAQITLPAPLPTTASSTTTPAAVVGALAAPTATAMINSTATPTMIATPTPASTATPLATATPVPPPVAQAQTILLLGVDARPGEGLLARSDALLLVRLDPQHNDVALLSMPRDLWVPIAGYGEGKINGAFLYGERAQAGGGVVLAKQTIEAAYNLSIDQIVVIDFAGFRSLIDALGGITVDVPKEIYDGSFPTDDYGYTVAHFNVGAEHMDGARALMYARTRHADSDFERIKRQQLVLLGIANRLRERGALQNLHEADRLTQALLPFVRTDMAPDQVVALLWNIRAINPQTVRRYTVEAGSVIETNVNGAYALVPRAGALRALGQQLLSTPTP